MAKSLLSMRSPEESQLTLLPKIRLRVLLFPKRKNQKTNSFGNGKIASFYALSGRKSVEFNVENQVASYVLIVKEEPKNE